MAKVKRSKTEIFVLKLKTDLPVKPRSFDYENKQAKTVSLFQENGKSGPRVLCFLTPSI